MARDELDHALALLGNEFGRVRALLAARRGGAGNSPCAARRALTSIRRGQLDRALGYAATALSRDSEWQQFERMVRELVQQLAAERAAALARLTSRG